MCEILLTAINGRHHDREGQKFIIVEGKDIPVHVSRLLGIWEIKVKDTGLTESNVSSIPANHFLELQTRLRSWLYLNDKAPSGAETVEC
jgi:hypothetical protein